MNSCFDQVDEDENKYKNRVFLHLLNGEIYKKLDTHPLADKLQVQVTPQFTDAVFQVLMFQTQFLAQDLEAFARHAKRSTINMDDVKLCLRRNPALQSLVMEKAEEIKSKKFKK